MLIIPHNFKEITAIPAPDEFVICSETGIYLLNHNLEKISDYQVPSHYPTSYFYRHVGKKICIKFSNEIYFSKNKKITQNQKEALFYKFNHDFKYFWQSANMEFFKMYLKIEKDCLCIYNETKSQIITYDSISFAKISPEGDKILLINKKEFVILDNPIC